MIADAEYERAVVEERDYIRTGYRFAMRMRGLERDESSLAHPAMGKPGPVGSIHASYPERSDSGFADDDRMARRDTIRTCDLCPRRANAKRYRSDAGGMHRKLAHALVAEPVEPEIESARLKYRRKLARVFEGIIEQGIREGEFPGQDVQASAACIVGSLFEGLVGPLALDSLSTAERQRQAKAIVAFCLRGTSGRME